MSRYISPFLALNILQKNGEVGAAGAYKYRFSGGELIVGDPAVASGAGNVIDPNLTATDGTAIQIVNSAGATDLAKIGQGTLTTAVATGQVLGNFYPAPHLLVGASPTLTTGLWYKVINGPITHNSIVYKTGQRFKATATATFTGTNGIVARDLDANIWEMSELNQRTENYRIQSLEVGDEAIWDESTYSVTSQAPGWVR